jgi:membrane protease YdiL (CAAX protease family)
MIRRPSWKVESDRRTLAGLAVFYPALIVGSALLECVSPRLGGWFSIHFISIYMWWVAVASIFARLACGESFRDLSLCRGGWTGTRAMLVGTALPLMVGFTAYGFGWRTGLVHFSATGVPPELFGVPLAGSACVRFLKLLLLSSTAGSLWSCKSAAGEEIGWRGYMLTRLIDSGFPAPMFMSGLVWALWHLPLIFFGQYPSVPHSIQSVCVFLADIMSLGYVFAWLRLSSGSVWPCVWAHAIWNSVIPGVFDGSTTGSGVWVGEAGILPTAVVTLLAATLHRLWPLPPRLFPDQPSGVKTHMPDPQRAPDQR